MNDLCNHLQNCIFDSSRIPDNVKNYIDNLDRKESNHKLHVHDEDTTDNYLNFNKNASLKARLFNKNSQLIISSLNNASKGNINNYSDILGTKDDFLNQILNSDQNNNFNNNHTKSHANSVIGSKIFNNNIGNAKSNTTNFGNSNTLFNNNINNNFNDNITSNLNNFSKVSNPTQNNMQGGNLGDYNFLMSKNNFNEFSLLHNNDQGSTLSQHSKTSSVYGDEHHLVNNEDTTNNINNFNSGIFN